MSPESHDPIIPRRYIAEKLAELSSENARLVRLNREQAIAHANLEADFLTLLDRLGKLYRDFHPNHKVPQ